MIKRTLLEIFEFALAAYFITAATAEDVLFWRGCYIFGAICWLGCAALSVAEDFRR